MKEKKEEDNKRKEDNIVRVGSKKVEMTDGKKKYNQYAKNITEYAYAVDRTLKNFKDCVIQGLGMSSNGRVVDLVEFLKRDKIEATDWKVGTVDSKDKKRKMTSLSVTLKRV